MWNQECVVEMSSGPKKFRSRVVQPYCKGEENNDNRFDEINQVIDSNSSSDAIDSLSDKDYTSSNDL